MPVYDCLAILAFLTLHVRNYTIAYYMLIALRLPVPVTAHLKL